jgi:dipeptidyl aminopeptidase/acylaminoacyl peptidase
MARKLSLAAALLVLPVTGRADQAAPPFTADDMLNVTTASVQDVSEDGRFVAFTERRTRDNAETDNYRYGDPTYLAPSAVRLVVVETATGRRMLPLGDRLANVRQAAFSPDGRRLAILVGAASPAATATQSMSLLTWTPGVVGATATPVAIKSPHTISASSALDWLPDGAHVVVSLRSAARDREAAQRFAQLTKGPIIVHSSKDPYLEWDDLNRANRWRTVSEVDVTTGVVSERLPERKLNAYTVSRDGSFVVYQEDATEKTDYDTIGGTESKLMVLSRGETEPKTILPARDLKGLTLRWSDDLRTFAYAKQGEVFVRGTLAADARSLTPKPKAPAAADAKPIVTPDEKKETETPESFSVTSFSRDGSKLLITSRKGWYVVNVADAARKQILTLDANEEKNPRISALTWSPDGASIYATWGARDKWERGLVRIDAATGTMTTVVKDRRLYGGVQLSRDGRRFVFSLSDGDRPADLQTADAAFTSITPLTALNPWLANRPLPKSELVKYRDVDGKELYGVLRYPIGYVAGQKYPTVFELYETFFDNGFNARAAFLASHGYAVFHPSVNLVVGRPGEAWVKGVTSAANKLIDMGVADPDRLGVHGTSYGGYATVLLLTQTDRFKAAINVSGKVDMVSFYTDSPRLGVRNTHAPEKSQDRIGGTLWEYPERYLEHSAILQADRIKTPLLNITGDQDPNVPASQSREIYYALRRLGRDVEWVRYVNGAHRPPNSVSEAIDFETRILAWYDKYLKPPVPPSPAPGGGKGGRD